MRSKQLESKFYANVVEGFPVIMALLPFYSACLSETSWQLLQDKKPTLDGSEGLSYLSRPSGEEGFNNGGTGGGGSGGDVESGMHLGATSYPAHDEQQLARGGLSFV